MLDVERRTLATIPWTLDERDAGMLGTLDTLDFVGWTLEALEVSEALEALDVGCGTF